MATVRKRGDTYQITVSGGYDIITGKQIRHYRTWKPGPNIKKSQIKKELQKEISKLEEKYQNGQGIDGNMTFENFSEKWFTEHAEKKLRATTIAGYRKLTTRIYDAIGHIRLNKLQPEHLQAFYDNLAEDGIRQNPIMHLRGNWAVLLKERGLTQSELARQTGIQVMQLSRAAHGGGLYRKNAEKVAEALDLPVEEVFAASEDKQLSGNTIRHYHNLISSILASAVKWRAIESNPCDFVDKPKIRHKEAESLDPDQAAALLKALEKEPEQKRALFSLALMTGLRRGELCGLEWRDIDWARGLLSVKRSGLYIPRRGVITDDTKTQKSQRVLKLTDGMLEILKTHLEEQNKTREQIGDQWQESGRIFTAWNGKALNPDTVSKWYSTFIQKNHLPKSHLHSLRHTNASLLIYTGATIPTVSAYLGHSSIQTTSNFYIHSIQAAEAAAATELEDFLKKKINS